MISLPDKLFLNTQIPCCLWFLTNDKTKNGRDRRNETLFIDARKLGTMKTRALKVLTQEDILTIANTVASWKKDENYNDIKGFCKSSNYEDIEKNEFVLTPGRYVGFEEEIDDGVPFEQKVSKLNDELLKLTIDGNELTKKIESNLKKIIK